MNKPDTKSTSCAPSKFECLKLLAEHCGSGHRFSCPPEALPRCRRFPNHAAALAEVAEREYRLSHTGRVQGPALRTVIHIESESYGNRNMDCRTSSNLCQLTTEYTATFTTKLIGERITA